MKVIIVLVLLVGVILPEAMSSFYATKYGSIRVPKSILEVRQDKAMVIRTNKDRRTSTTLMRKRDFLPTNVDQDIENDINVEMVPQPEHKLASKYIGYKCPLNANSNGNGRAIIKADPYDCSGYYYCVWGIPQTFTCPSPTLWNDKDECCDWPTKVNCGYRHLHKSNYF